MSSNSTLQIEIKGIGHCPSFKNTKSIFRNHKTGKPFIATQPKKKQWMEQAIQLIASQLCSAYRTTSNGTQTAPSLPSWIAASAPLDDSWQWVPEHHVTTVKCAKGEEGATITITRL